MTSKKLNFDDTKNVSVMIKIMNWMMKIIVFSLNGVIMNKLMKLNVIKLIKRSMIKVLRMCIIELIRKLII